MQPIINPPFPFALSTMSPQEQAKAAMGMYVGVLDTLGQCLKSRDTLIRWIAGE